MGDRESLDCSILVGAPLTAPGVNLDAVLGLRGTVRWGVPLLRAGHL